MFRVTADSLEDYFDFDPKRKSDLQQLDRLIRKAAPKLKRYFHRGTPAGQPGMRMTMIGYGRMHHALKSGATLEWPAIGVALQKNYISVYFSVMAGDAPVAARYVGKLGELRSGDNNFSFVRFDNLNVDALSSLIGEAAKIYGADPENPVRDKKGR